MFVGALLAAILGWALGGEDAFRASLWTSSLALATAFAASIALGNTGPRALTHFSCRPRDLLWSVAGGAATFAVSLGYAYLLAKLLSRNSELVRGESGLAHSYEVWLSSVLFAPVCEELLCRGAAWHALELGMPRRPFERVLATAAMFALLHGLNGAFVLELPHRFVAGVIFGWLRLRTNSLTPPIVAHAVNNALALLV